MLVDFELGRLSPRRSSAVEQHVRTCEICKSQGLGHAVTERRQIIRKLDRVRPSRRVFSKRARGVLLVLAVALLFELIVFELLQPDSTLHRLLGVSPTAVPISTETPSAFQMDDSFGLTSVITVVAPSGLL